jgi:hypothetical protein
MPKAKVARRKPAKRPPPKVPPPAPAPDPQYWHVYRVNRLKTIFWQLPLAFLSQQAAEMEPSRLDGLAVINQKNYFYAAMDGAASLHLWLGYDVRPAKLPAGSKPKRKPVIPQSKKEENGLEGPEWRWPL